MATFSTRTSPNSGPSWITLPDGSRHSSADVLSTVVQKYFDDHPAVMPLYDLTNAGPHNEILPIDLLALNALNAFQGTQPMGPMTQMWQRRQELEPLVALIDPQRTVEEFDDNGLIAEAEKLDVALCKMEEVTGFGARQNPDQQGTRAAKLMHRLRPNLMPIWDLKVFTWYGNQPVWKNWIVRVYKDVREPDTLAGLKWISARIGGLPLLRIWDIILWTLQNDGRQAINDAPGRADPAHGQ